MNSLHDLGGMTGFGRVRITPEGDPFHSDAERGVFRIMMGAMMAGWGDADGFRAAVEALPAAIYIRECFPTNYLAGLEIQLAERGLVSKQLLDAVSRGDAVQLPPVPNRPQVIPEYKEHPLPARFRVNDEVRVRSINPIGHTRCPRYLRGHVGTIFAERGTFDFPDALAARAGRCPQPVYTVRFHARNVWDQAAEGDLLHAEFFDNYLEPVEVADVH